VANEAAIDLSARGEFTYSHISFLTLYHGIESTIDLMTVPSVAEHCSAAILAHILGVSQFAAFVVQSWACRAR